MASWCSSSTWMLLPLLLVFFHTFRLSPCAPADPNSELLTQINELGKVVECHMKKINKTCNTFISLNLTEAFKLKETEGKQKTVCASHHYFISGLELYKDKLRELPAEHCQSRPNFRHLISKLNVTLLPELCEWEDELKAIISPCKLHKVLENKIQRHNSVA